MGRSGCFNHALQYGVANPFLWSWCSTSRSQHGLPSWLQAQEMQHKRPATEYSSWGCIACT